MMLRTHPDANASPASHGSSRILKYEEDVMRPNAGPIDAIKRYLPLVVLIALAVFAFCMGWHRYLTLEQLAMHRGILNRYVEENWVISLAAYMAIYIAAVALSLPGGALLTIAGGLLFGWVAGGCAVVFAATIGASILFLVARTSLGEVLAERAGPTIEKLRQGFQEDAFNYLLFLRLVPAFPFWLVNLAPALLGVSLRTFATATLIGIIPGTFAFAFIGAGLDSVIDAQIKANPSCQAGNVATCKFEIDTGALVTPQILIAFAALGVVAIIPVVVKKIRARRMSLR